MKIKYITVWKDATWKCWDRLDAEHARNDENWLLEIPIEVVKKKITETYII